MDDSKRLLSWLLEYTLEEHFMGNKSRMAQEMHIHRHTLWRAFRIIEDKAEGEISPLVAQQLMCWYVRRKLSIDKPIWKYLDSLTDVQKSQCKHALSWMKDVHAMRQNADSSFIAAIVTHVMPKWQALLGCQSIDATKSGNPANYCRHEQACPILKFMEIAKVESAKMQEVRLSLDS